jgi:thiamine kinase-like enzyme
MRLPEVEELCRGVVPGAGAVAVAALGAGLLSDTYRVERDSAVYTLKIAADPALEPVADLAWEARLLEPAAAAGIAPRVAYSNPARKVLLTHWAAGRQWSNEDAKNPASICRIAALLQRVHALTVPAPPRRISPAGWIDLYSSALAQRGLDTGDAGLCAAAAGRVQQLGQLFAPAASVVCHSDLHALNLIEQKDALILLDWEYAHVADPLWDLAGWSANNDLDSESQWRLLTDYGGASPLSGDWQRLRLNLWLYDYVCLLWSRLYLGKRGEPGDDVGERARLLDARLRLPAHYAA